MTASTLDVAVVGAGAAGLAAAAELARAGLAVRVLEADARAGGAMWSERVRGHLVERGPNTLRIKPGLQAFLARHGLEEQLERAEPASRKRFLLRGGVLVPVPLGPAAFATTPLLSPRGKLRLLAEPFVRRGDPSGESVAEFVTRRLGREATERLVGPFLTGIYAGDETRLGAEAVFPTLVAAERARGSIVRGLLAGALRRGRERGLAGTWSARDGFGALAGALARPIASEIALGTRVETLAWDREGFRLACRGSARDDVVRARAVVLAAPAREAAALLEPLDPDVSRTVAAIDYAPVASVSLSADPAAVSTRGEGFGFLVPRGEGDALLGCLYPSRLFPGRAPPGRVLLTALLGGVRRPDALALADDELYRVTVAELDRALGVSGAPELLATTRWPRAVPQPGPDHPRRVADVRSRLARFPGLELAGAHLDGVALADALLSGAAAAARVRTRLVEGKGGIVS